MPPSASSNLPRRSAAAPVNAPFSWPKSSLSISSVGIAAQFTLTNGPGGKRALAVDVRGQQFLAGAGLARQQHAGVGSRHLRRLLHGLLERGRCPIIRGASPTSSRNRWFSRCRSDRSSAFFTTSSTRSRASGFSRKSKAPLLRRLHRVAIVPWPEIITTGASLVALPQRAQQVDAVAVGQPHVEQVEVGRGAAAFGRERRTESQTLTP